MIRSLNTGVAGIRNFQTSLDVIGNNLANINTVGFKGGRVDFAETLAQTIRPATPDTATASGSSGIQLANGVSTAAVKSSFTQGAINQTGNSTDLAVAGQGYFIVRNSSTGAQYATRAGGFRLDSNGFLVTNSGMRIQGVSEAIGQPGAVGDIKFNRGEYGSSVSVLDVGTWQASDSTFQVPVDKSEEVSVIRTKGPHGYETGNVVEYTKSGQAPETITAGKQYFVRRISDNAMELYENLHDATTGLETDKSIKFKASEIDETMRLIGRLKSYESVHVTGIDGDTVSTLGNHGYKDGDEVRFYVPVGGANEPTMDGDTDPIKRVTDDTKEDFGYTVKSFFIRVKGAQSFTVHNTVEEAIIGSSAVRFKNDSINNVTLAKLSASSTSQISSINVDSAGRINVLLTDGTQYTRGQILLQKFNNENALRKEGGNLYSGLASAGPLDNNVRGGMKAPGSSGLGRIESGALELSNIDVAREFSKLITTQRAFQANARMVTASDEILNELLRLKR